MEPDPSPMPPAGQDVSAANSLTTSHLIHASHGRRYHSDRQHMSSMSHLRKPFVKPVLERSFDDPAQSEKMCGC